MSHATSTPSVAGNTSQTVCAPERPPLLHSARLFLAGTTPLKGSPHDWRKTVCGAIAHLPVTILDPVNNDESVWKCEDQSNPVFHAQVSWELDMQETATLIAFYFDRDKPGTVSLLELGLCAGRSATTIVACPAGYSKRGNVQVVCARYSIQLVDSVEALAQAVKQAICEAVSQCQG